MNPKLVEKKASNEAVNRRQMAPFNLSHRRGGMVERPVELGRRVGVKEGWVSCYSPTNPRSPGRRGAIVVIGLADCADKLKSGRALEFDAGMRIFWHKRITSDRADRSKVRQMAHQNFGAKKYRAD